MPHCAKNSPERIDKPLVFCYNENERFFAAIHERSLIQLKKVIRFFAKIGNQIRARLRSFAWRKFLPWCALFLGICIFFVASALAISGAVKRKTASHITTIDALCEAGEHFDVILVLGCAVRPDGTPSHMLEDRIKTSVSAYQTGLGDVILMSGDRHENYDEVGAMQREAQTMGVSTDKILLDPQGYSTYESVFNLLEEHKGKRVLIVTQEYHLYRSLYIAEKLCIEAYGISADLRPYRKQVQYDLREILARLKDVFWVEYNNAKTER